MCITPHTLKASIALLRCCVAACVFRVVRVFIYRSGPRSNVPTTHVHVHVNIYTHTHIGYVQFFPLGIYIHTVYMTYDLYCIPTHAFTLHFQFEPFFRKLAHQAVQPYTIKWKKTWKKGPARRANNFNMSKVMYNHESIR